MVVTATIFITQIAIKDIEYIFDGRQTPGGGGGGVL